MLTKADLIKLLFTIQSDIGVNGSDCEAPPTIYMQLNSGPITLGEALTLTYNQLSLAHRFEIGEQLKNLARDEAERNAHEVRYRLRLEAKRQAEFEDFERYLVLVREAWLDREEKRAFTEAAQRDIRYYSALREFEDYYVDCVIEAERAHMQTPPRDLLDDPDDGPPDSGRGLHMN